MVDATRHLVTLSDVQRREVVWLHAGTIPRGMLSLLAGHPGLGKSLWTVMLAAHLSKQGLATVICSAEDSLEHSIKPRLQAAEADTSLIHALIPRDKDDNPRGVTFPSDAALLMDAVISTEAVLAVIDPVTAHLDHDIDSHRDASLREALAPLSRIAEETLAAMIAVYHLNKTGGTDPMMRLGGSIGGPGQARSALLIDRDPDDPDKDRGQRRVLAHFKCNVGPLQPSRQLEVEPIHLEATNGEPALDTARITDRGESHHGASGLLGANADDDRSAYDEACDFLRAELADGVHVSSKIILKRSREIGISERTLRRAKTTVGVIATKSGFGDAGAWTWHIASMNGKAATPENSTKAATDLEDVAALASRARARGNRFLAALEDSDTPNTTTQATNTKAAKELSDMAALDDLVDDDALRLPTDVPPCARAREDDPDIHDDDIPF